MSSAFTISHIGRQGEWQSFDAYRASLRQWERVWVDDPWRGTTPELVRYHTSRIEALEPAEWEEQKIGVAQPFVRICRCPRCKQPHRVPVYSRSAFRKSKLPKPICRNSSTQ
jgi:hypothetical protein